MAVSAWRIWGKNHFFAQIFFSWGSSAAAGAALPWPHNFSNGPAKLRAATLQKVTFI